MASYQISWRSSTKKDLRKLPPQQVARIVDSVEALSRDPLPVGVQKLTGSERTYRIRIGDYRVVYEFRPADQVVQIERVRHRKDVYRD